MACVYCKFETLNYAFVISCAKGLTKPDSRLVSILGRKQERLDATLAYQNMAYDVDRVQLKYASKYGNMPNIVVVVGYIEIFDIL